jgi:hypothetical protein
MGRKEGSEDGKFLWQMNDEAAVLPKHAIPHTGKLPDSAPRPGGRDHVCRERARVSAGDRGVWFYYANCLNWLGQ